VQDYNNPQTLNRYNYCVGNPVKYNDPDGHFNVSSDDGAWDAGTLTVVVVPAVIQSGGVGTGFAPIDDSQFAPDMPLQDDAPDSSVIIQDSYKDENTTINDGAKSARMVSELFGAAFGIYEAITGIADIALGISAIVTTEGLGVGPGLFLIGKGIGEVWVGYQIASKCINAYYDEVNEVMGDDINVPELPPTGPLPWPK
jgi:hypothetical protein